MLFLIIPKSGYCAGLPLNLTLHKIKKHNEKISKIISIVFMHDRAFDGSGEWYEFYG